MCKYMYKLINRHISISVISQVYTLQQRVIGEHQFERFVTELVYLTFRETNTAVTINDFIMEYRRGNNSDLCMFPSSYEPNAKYNPWFPQCRIFHGYHSGFRVSRIYMTCRNISLCKHSRNVSITLTLTIDVPHRQIKFTVSKFPSSRDSACERSPSVTSSSVIQETQSTLALQNYILRT